LGTTSRKKERFPVIVVFRITSYLWDCMRRRNGNKNGDPFKKLFESYLRNYLLNFIISRLILTRPYKYTASVNLSKMSSCEYGIIFFNFVSSISLPNPLLVTLAVLAAQSVGKIKNFDELLVPEKFMAIDDAHCPSIAPASHKKSLTVRKCSVAMEY
jgi:hypothetical protein